MDYFKWIKAIKYDHKPTNICSDCHLLFSSLESIEKLTKKVAENPLVAELLYDFSISASSILMWMKHLIRDVQQRRAKSDAMEKLDNDTDFCIRDWSQKILPMQFREPQKDYFGKRGFSEHIDVFFTKDSNHNIIKHVYFTMLTQSDQSTADTLAIFEHVLKQFHPDNPHIRKLYVKSNNDGCYAGNSYAELSHSICKSLGIELLRHDYNEPQRGKDQCDRESANLKNRIRTCMDDGHNVTSVEELFEAHMYMGGIRNSASSAVAINKTQQKMTGSTIKNISFYHSVEFEKTGMRFW
ncbi:unnamed protein product [Didymodactylos carnosus]|uniref:Uncharacterized protein n=1 Tax=Didymodactylos carnosus TaxID=1234261 RepID=A0A815AJ55_9BILA|nr:unnamed protein product [Didymodactylos carnosus]CAF4027342.1 unnamed protein product [Didymodactylos carnosus]